jgi:hypothetical protein
MDYLNLKNIEAHLHSLTKVSNEESLLFGEFVPINCGTFTVHLSAGKSSLSNPQLELNNVLYYDSVQIMIRESVKDQLLDICPLSDDRFKGFDWAKHFTYVSRLGNVLPSYMGAYVPKQDVLQLIREVYRVSRLRTFF